MFQRGRPFTHLSRQSRAVKLNVIWKEYCTQHVGIELNYQKPQRNLMNREDSP